MDTTSSHVPEAYEGYLPVARPRRRRLRVAEVLIWVVCLSLLAVVGLAIRDAQTAPEKRILPGIQALGMIFGADPFQAKSQITLLLVGTDQTNDLSDTIMLAFIDRETRRIGLLSFPRDLRVATGPDNACAKINAVIPNTIASGGDMRQGVHALSETLRRTFGVVVDGYAQIDVHAFVEVIDRIGGVEVEVPPGPRGDGLHYDDNYQNLHIHLQPGKQKLMGYDAMGFVRWRQDRGGRGDGDPGRMARQRELLQAVASEVALKLRQKDLEAASIAANLAATAHNHVTTNLDVTQIAAIASMAREVDMAGIEARQVPVAGQGSGSDGAFYFFPDPQATRSVVRAMWAELRQEKPLAAMARVEVLNGCGVTGLASKCEGLLVKEEFRVGHVGDLTDEQGEIKYGVENTYLRCAPGFEAAADEVKRSLDLAMANVIADLPPDGECDIRVVLGDDYASKF